MYLCNWVHFHSKRYSSTEKGHNWRQPPRGYALDPLLMLCWLCWGLTSLSTIFQSCRDGAIASWVINQYFRGVKCLAQGHNTAEVGLEPRTSRSGVRHSTTEPPRSPNAIYTKFQLNKFDFVKLSNLHENIVREIWEGKRESERALSHVSQVSDLKRNVRFINGPPADKRDLTTKYENLKMMHILKILSMWSHSWKYQWSIVKYKGTTHF